MTPLELGDLLLQLPSNLNEVPDERRNLVLHEDPEKRESVLGACRICRLHGVLRLTNSYCGNCHDFCCPEHMGWSAHRPRPLCQVCGMNKAERERRGLFTLTEAKKLQER